LRESDKTAEIVAAGVALPVVCIEFLARYGRSPAFAVVAVGSANGEGRLFQPPLTGSRAMSRTLDDRPVAAEEAGLEELKDIAAQRGVEARINRAQGGIQAVFAPWRWSGAISTQTPDILEHFSGASHDAMAMVDVAPFGMLFARYGPGSGIADPAAG
jgi:hypothetical protein